MPSKRSKVLAPAVAPRLDEAKPEMMPRAGLNHIKASENNNNETSPLPHLPIKPRQNLDRISTQLKCSAYLTLPEKTSSY